MQTVTQADVDTAKALADKLWNEYRALPELIALNDEFVKLQKRIAEINKRNDELSEPWFQAQGIADKLEHQFNQPKETQKEQNQ